MEVTVGVSVPRYAFLSILGKESILMPGNSFHRSFLPLFFIVPHAALLQHASAGHPRNEFWSTTGCALENFISAARSDNIPRRRQAGPLRANIFYPGAICSCFFCGALPCVYPMDV